MAHHLVAVVVATVVAAKKRKQPRRRRAARRHHVGFFGWLKRWRRAQRRKDEMNARSSGRPSPPTRKQP